MKVGHLEGTPQEIKDLMENHGLNLADYLEKPERPMCKRWIALPIILYTSCIIATSLLLESYKSISGISFILSFGVAIWLSVTLQVRFKSSWASGLAILSLSLLSLLSYGIIQPQEIIPYMQAFSDKK